MSSRLNLERARALALGLVATGTLVAAGPCDIYADADTPCVAAHSTTRALYNDYSDALYQVQRDSDGTTTDIAPLSAGGVADASAQDDFCEDTDCLISIIYDQSGQGNHLTQAPPGGAAEGPEEGGYDSLADATAAPITLDGQKAYGVFIAPGMGYRNNNATGTATGDDPEGMYAVLDGTHYNEFCCFDYGNVEVNTLDNGNGHMETIYFGSNKDYGYGTGDGPWVMADLENNLAAKEENGENSDMDTLSDRFVTAIVKGEPGGWAIRGGNANDGGLSTYYNGIRPTAGGYDPMSKEGAIVLGVGGDNSNWAEGTFYEGVMTAGYPTDETEDSVQEDIVAANYGA